MGAAFAFIGERACRESRIDPDAHYRVGGIGSGDFAPSSARCSISFTCDRAMARSNIDAWSRQREMLGFPSH
jgi:hypothetical protein